MAIIGPCILLSSAAYLARTLFRNTPIDTLEAVACYYSPLMHT